MRYIWPVLLLMMGMVFSVGTVIIIKNIREETTTGNMGENILALVLGVILTFGAFGSGYKIWPSSISDKTSVVDEKPINPISSSMAKDDDSDLTSVMTASPPGVYQDNDSENVPEDLMPKKSASLRHNGNKSPTGKTAPLVKSSDKEKNVSNAGKTVILPPAGEITPPQNHGK